LVSSSGAINVSGDLLNNGSFNHNTGTVYFNDGANQSIGMNEGTLNKITVNKSSGDLTLTSSLNLISVLEIQSTSTDFKSDGFLTLLSSSDSPDITASIASLSGTSKVSGFVTVQRFIGLEDRIYRYMSSPIKDTKVSDWQDDISITGNFNGKSTVDPFNSSTIICGTKIVPTSASLFKYNEAVQGIADNGYVAFPSSINSEKFEIGRGYAAFVRESCYRSVLLDVTGEINMGGFSLPVSYNPGSIPSAIDDGWNLVGNPYPSPIHWDNIISGATSISPSIAIRDNGSGGMLRYYDGAGGSPDDFAGVISTGQAFWVRATASDPNLPITEAAKVNTIGHSFYRTKSNESLSSTLEITLRKGSVIDKAVAKVRAKSSEGLDDWDAPKLNNQLADEELFDLAIETTDGIPMAINNVPFIYNGMLLPLLTRDLEDGLYEMQIDPKGEFQKFQVQILDMLTNRKTIINTGDSFPFNITVGQDQLNSNNRFKLILVDRNTDDGISVSLRAYPNPFNRTFTLDWLGLEEAGKLAIFSELGQKLREIDLDPELFRVEIDFNSEPSGVYLIRLVGNGYTRWTKVIKD
jgi:hypothetical protein